MPYVQRDANGNIAGLFTAAQTFALEFLPDNDAAVVAFTNPPVVPRFLARDLLAQLQPADYMAIENAISPVTSQNAQLGLLWSATQAQGEAPIATGSARFRAGWAALVQILGQERMTAVASALSIPNTYS